MAVLGDDDAVLYCQNLVFFVVCFLAGFGLATAQGCLLASFLLINISCRGCLGMGVLFPAFGLTCWAFSQI